MYMAFNVCCFIMKSNYLQVNNTPKKALTHVTGEFIIEIRKVGPDGQELEPKPSSSGSLVSSKIGQKKIPMTYTEKKVRARQNEVSLCLKNMMTELFFMLLSGHQRSKMFLML